MKTYDELKNMIFEEASYFGSCADDPFFADDERDEFGVKFEGIFDLIRRLGLEKEFMGIA